MTKSKVLVAWLGNAMGKPPGFERIVRWFASPEKCRHLPEMCLLREGFVFLARPAVQLDWHVMFFGTYEPEVRCIFRTLLPPDGVAVDVGANVGWHTLLMASLVGANGRVLAVEANPAIRQRLIENLRMNHFNNVEVIPCALANSEEPMNFYAPPVYSPDSGNGYVISPDPTPRTNSIRVQARRLDAIVEHSGIKRLDLIKIDVEGFEWRVLQGGHETIAKFRPHIVFEYNSEFVRRGGGTPALIGDFLRNQGYRLFAVGKNCAEAIEEDRWPQCADIWAAPFE